MNAQSLFFASALLLLFASGAYADGKYQRTKDGQIRVWNNFPQPGDAATWSGARDAFGYATGYGTITWYTTNRKTLTASNLSAARYTEVSSYSGTMIHGKLDGAVVNVDSDGKSFHGTFIDGHKTSDWAAGPAPNPSSPIALPEEPTSPRPEPSVVALEQLRKEIARQGSVAQAPAPEPPAEGPRSTPVPVPPPTQRDGVTNPPPVSRANESATSAPDRDVVATPVAKTSPATAESLRSLTGPPPSLTRNSVAEPSSPPAATSTSSSPPPVGSRLTTSEVMVLADTEARNHGYDLRAYQRRRLEYVEAGGTWSVSYDQISANGMPGRQFSVSVDDRTKKASVDAER